MQANLIPGRHFRPHSGRTLLLIATVLTGSLPLLPSPVAAQESATPAPQPPTPAQDHNTAVDATKIEASPYDPDDILDVAKRINGGLRAAQQNLGPPPTATSRSVTADVSPGAKAIDVHLRQGFPCVVTFLDSSGQPWPTAAISSGRGPEDFQVEALPDKGGPMIKIVPVQAFPQFAGVSVVLAGLNAVVTFSVSADDAAAIDSSIQVHVPGYGPNAKPALTQRSRDIVAGDATLQSFLDGVPPPTAQRLTVTDADLDTRITAWLLDGHLYVRSRDTLLSPEPSDVMHAAAITAYRISPTPVLVISADGQPHRVHLTPADHAGPR